MSAAITSRQTLLLQARLAPIGTIKWFICDFCRRRATWNDCKRIPNALTHMTRLHTLGWLAPASAAILPLGDGAWLRSLRQLALTAELAQRSVAQLQHATALQTLCISKPVSRSPLAAAGADDAGLLQQILELAEQLPSLTRLACNCGEGHANGQLEAAIAALQQAKPELRFERSTAACLAEMRKKYS